MCSIILVIKHFKVIIMSNLRDKAVYRCYFCTIFNTKVNNANTIIELNGVKHKVDSCKGECNKPYKDFSENMKEIGYVQ